MASRGLLAHREGDRGYPWLWFVRAIGLVVTIITLGLTATGAASFHTIACDSPAKLNYNIAVVRFILHAWITHNTPSAHIFTLSDFLRSRS